MINENFDPSKFTFDEPIRVFSSPKEPEPKQIYISTAGTYDTPYYQMYKEYMDRLAYERSCRATPIYIKVTEEFAHYLEANYKYEMSYKTDDVPSGVYGHWTGIPVVVDNTLKDKLYEFEFKTEQEKQKFERGLRAKISSLYNDVMTEDGLTFMTNEKIVDKFNSISRTSFMLTPEQIEELLDKENNN